MDPPSKRRKVLQRAQDTLEGITRSTEQLMAHTSAPDNLSSFGKQLPLRAAMAESRRGSNFITRKDPPLAAQGRPKPERLHPRQLGTFGAAQPVVQPVQTAVASYINVVLDSGGTSIGNVLVPAESTIFNLDGYGPVTINRNNDPTKPTPANSGPTSRPHRHSHAAQQTMQPGPPQTQQEGPEPDDYTSSRVELTSDLVVPSHTSTAEPIQLGELIVNSKRVILWPDILSNGNSHPNKFHPDVFRLGHCAPPDDNKGCICSERELDHFFTFSDIGVPGGGVGTPTGTPGGEPSSSTTAASGSGGGSTPSTPTLVGGVVGGLAGLALIIVLIIFLLRRRKQISQHRTISPPLPQSASTGPGATSGTMTERSSAAVPFASAAFFRRMRPGSGATATTTETTPSERGFQNLGGRKLASVLSSRGDGYGDIPFGAAGTSAAPGPSSAQGQPPPSIPIVAGAPGAAPGHSSPGSLSDSSFYRDSQGFYGGPGRGQPGHEPPSNSSSMFVGPASPPQSPTHPPPGLQPAQEGIAVMRPGPARTPITTEGGLSPMRGPPTRGTSPPHVPQTIQERPRDGVGRSHPSSDGSRGFRFAEDL
ncbi:MAG: hypothetical protein Q9172_000313 [Xanthocarpia lactea]